jgi:hypothetical protein
MDIKRKFEKSGPDGLQIYESYIEPAGAYWQNSDVLKFIAGGTRLSLELEREPRNKYDSNAIKVIGVVRGWLLSSRYHIGYVPAAIAKKLVLGKFWPNVAATLRMVEAREYTHVKFDLLGPVGRKKEYVAFNA